MYPGLSVPALLVGRTITILVRAPPLATAVTLLGDFESVPPQPDMLTARAMTPTAIQSLLVVLPFTHTYYAQLWRNASDTRQDLLGGLIHGYQSPPDRVFGTHTPG